MRINKILTTIAVLCIVAQGIWAQSPTVVSTESALRTALQIDGANIQLGANIDLSNSTLSIAENTTITLDLNSFTLDRKLTQRGEDGGQVITVRSGAILNLSNGTLQGGWGGDSGGINNEGGTANLTNVTITGCTGDDRGGGICNRSGSTLTMTGGSITNNISNDHTSPSGGGGIFNAEGATMTLTGVTITGNEAKGTGGGGICNYGTLNIDGCTIQHNTARTSGGGIWSGNEKHLLRMQGAVIITDNTAGSITSNLFLSNRRLITVTGSLTGSRIGVTLEVIPNMFTTGFATYHSGDDFSTIFQCDRPETDSLSTVQPLPYYHDIGEVLLSNRVHAGTYPYVEHSWDSENKKVLSTTKFVTEEIDFNATPTSETQYKRLYSTDDAYVDLGTENSELHEYYVVDDPDDEVNIRSLTVNGPNVHIIICDGSRLHFNEDITVSENQTLYIHVQSAGSTMGRLFNDSDYNTYGGIGGGGITKVGGNIEIHGGNLNIHGGNQSAAIGGDYETRTGDITIYDGRITVVGGGCSAGIGAGMSSKDYGNITIYDGWIDATGGTAANPLEECGGAGIGGGRSCLNGRLTIWGGTITSKGDHESAGIGSAQYGGDHGAGTITINGGNIKAYGDDYGAGIGGGDGKNGGTLIVNGGRVEAYGGTDAAGIGGGEDGNGGYVTINGGYVYAEGGWEYGAGIGGGQDGAGANVTITGGIVVAKSGNVGVGGMRGIGPGGGSNDYGELTIGDGMMVSSWNGGEGPFPADERKDYCWYHTQARIEPCTHEGATISIIDASCHSVAGCAYCTISTQPHYFDILGECTACHLISLANDADNSSVLIRWDGATDKSVTLSGRTLKKNGNWNTLCLPFDLTFGGTSLEDAIVKELDVEGTYDTKQTGFDEATGTLSLYFKDAASIVAGKPYIVKWTKPDDYDEHPDNYDISNPLFTGVTFSNETSDVTSADGNVSFKGCFNPVDIPAEDKTLLYMGTGNTLYYPDAAMTINAFRSFFCLKGIEAGDGPDGVRSFNLNFGETTSIELRNSSIEDLKLDGEWYDLSGRRVVAPKKGVYILNGKKVVVK